MEFMGYRVHCLRDPTFNRFTQYRLVTDGLTSWQTDTMTAVRLILSSCLSLCDYLRFLFGA